MICGLNVTHSHSTKITKWPHILVIPLGFFGAFGWFWLQPKRWEYIFWFFDIFLSMAISPHTHKLKSKTNTNLPIFMGTYLGNAKSWFLKIFPCCPFGKRRETQFYLEMLFSFLIKYQIFIGQYRVILWFWSSASLSHLSPKSC